MFTTDNIHGSRSDRRRSQTGSHRLLRRRRQLFVLVGRYRLFQRNGCHSCNHAAIGFGRNAGGACCTEHEYRALLLCRPDVECVSCQACIRSRSRDGCICFYRRWRLVHVVKNSTRINPSFRDNLVFSQVDGGFFTPGTAYYVRVSAINSAGTSEAQEAETKDLCGEVDQACSPRAPPPPPVDAKVPLTPCSKCQCDARTLNV